MLDIRANIHETFQKYRGNYVQFLVEIIARYLAYSVFAIVSVAIFSFCIGLMALGLFVAFYDKSSYPAFDYLIKVLHGNFVYDFYYSHIDHSYRQIISNYKLSSNIARSGYLATINIVIATLSAYTIAIFGILAFIYTNLRLTFLDFKPKSLFFRTISKLYGYIIYALFIVCIPAFFVAGFIAAAIAYYVYILIKLVVYILIPVSVILSIISFFFGKIIFSGIGLAQLGDLGLVNGVIFFAHYIWDALFYITFVSMFLHLEDFNNSTQPSKSIKPKTNNDQLNIKIAGVEGEKKFQDKLDDLGMKLATKYISSGNMLYGQSWVAEIDFLIMAPNIGLVVVEVKNYNGEILCSNEDKWTRVKYDNYGNQVGTTYESNVSKQVITTTSQLTKILSLHKINKWKITPVVVLVNPKAEVIELESNKPQTDVITIEQFESWLEKLPKDYSQQFSDDDYQQISDAIQVAENRYQNSDNPKVVAIRKNQESENKILGAH